MNNDSGISSTISLPSTLTTKSEVKIPLTRNSLRASGAGRGIVWIAIMCWMLAGSLVSGDDLVIDSFQYASPAAAQAVWVRPYADASQLVIPVTEASVPCLSLPNIFTPATARGAWDRTISLDLSAYSSISVRLKSTRPSMSMSIFFQTTGGGWYCKTFFITDQWATYVFPLLSFRVGDGSASGWNNVTKVRLSCWQHLDTSPATGGKHWAVSSAGTGVFSCPTTRGSLSRKVPCIMVCPPCQRRQSADG